MDRRNLNFLHGLLQTLAHIWCHCLSENAAEKDKVTQAANCCRKILNHVNQAVKESEYKQVCCFIKSPFTLRGVSETFLFPPSPSSSKVHPVPQLILFSGRGFLLKNACSSSFLSLPEVGGLSKEIGPFLTKADWQPNDPGAKGEWATI